jgi:hypothetical protein
MFIKWDRKQLMKLGMLADTEILTTHQLSSSSQVWMGIESGMRIFSPHQMANVI